MADFRGFFKKRAKGDFKSKSKQLTKAQRYQQERRAAMDSAKAKRLARQKNKGKY